MSNSSANPFALSLYSESTAITSANHPDTRHYHFSTGLLQQHPKRFSSAAFIKIVIRLISQNSNKIITLLLNAQRLLSSLAVKAEVLTVIFKDVYDLSFSHLCFPSNLTSYHCSPSLISLQPTGLWSSNLVNIAHYLLCREETYSWLTTILFRPLLKCHLPKPSYVK